MAFGFSLRVSLLMSVWLTVKCVNVPDGVLSIECRDRYFIISADLSFTGSEPRFEAVDDTGLYLITEEYGAKCGYTVEFLPLQNRVVLRASYFSCHTHNRDDKKFSFSLLLSAVHEGIDVNYTLSKTCYTFLPWSHREVTCEANYMEVSVRSEVTCPFWRDEDDWNALRFTHHSTTSDWQVIFQNGDIQTSTMSLSEAQKQGYMFYLTDGRLVFRTPYGQPDSSSTEVNGVRVEVVHATLFSRQSWVVLMVDLVASCSMYVGTYDDGYIIWQTPERLYPSLGSTLLNLGVDGELMAQKVAEERGYIVEKHNTTVQIRIPHDAEGGYRKSILTGDLFEVYVFHLYLEQFLVDEVQMETRLRFHRTLASPLLLHRVFTLNQTVTQDGMFTVYLGNVPEDVELATVYLNGQEYAVSFTHNSSDDIREVFHPNNTHGYTLKIPFEDSVVQQKFSKEDSVLQYRLDINYTLIVFPENEPCYHLASVVALVTVSPPALDADCLDFGISFKLERRPYDYMWEIGIGSNLLTSELAAKHGYIMRNDSHSLLLEVPLFTRGYQYKEITLKGFFGTFEILIWDRETSEVQSSTVKTCPFNTTELILCSTDGWMTVVADLGLANPTGTVPVRVNLIDKNCCPKDTDNTRALFSFPLHTCGSTVKLGLRSVTYQNEILYTSVSNVTERYVTESVTIHCTYPLAGLHLLFTQFRFESDTDGYGDIIHTPQSATGLQSPNLKPTTPLRTT